MVEVVGRPPRDGLPAVPDGDGRPGAGPVALAGRCVGLWSAADVLRPGRASRAGRRADRATGRFVVARPSISRRRRRTSMLARAAVRSLTGARLSPWRPGSWLAVRDWSSWLTARHRVGASCRRWIALGGRGRRSSVWSRRRRRAAMVRSDAVRRLACAVAARLGGPARRRSRRDRSSPTPARRPARAGPSPRLRALPVRAGPDRRHRAAGRLVPRHTPGRRPVHRAARSEDVPALVAAQPGLQPGGEPTTPRAWPTGPPGSATTSASTGTHGRVRPGLPAPTATASSGATRR